MPNVERKVYAENLTEAKRKARRTWVDYEIVDSLAPKERVFFIYMRKKKVKKK